MGIIRVLLAISVVIAHTNKIFGFGLVGGQIAVQVFYIISGFYMTLILNEKYIGINNSYKLFISNRLLRLYPIYWTVFILTLITSIGLYIISSGHSFGKLQPYFDNISMMNFGSIFFLILTNIILLFQDWVMFLGIDLNSGGLFFTSNFRETKPALYHFLIIPQAWTIGIEITFYLIAPFIVKKSVRVVCLLILSSVLLRVLIYASGFKHDPWTYRFFPTELLFFLLGTIAYHGYKKIEVLNIKGTYLKIIYFSVLIFTFSFSWIPFQYKTYLYMGLFFLSLPFIFILSKKWKIDRYIGELSYPVYICHMLVLMMVEYTGFDINQGVITIVISILLSVLLNELIAKKIESIRQSRVLITNDK